MTRREQFLKRRARFKKRRERARSVNSIWGRDPVTGKTKRLGYRVTWERDGVQMPGRVASKSYDWQDWPEPPVPGAPFVISKIGPRRPPHVSIPAPFKRPNLTLPSSADYAAIGYHRKRVQRWKRKPNRLSKFERAVYIANLLAWRNGWFEAWDPLGRHPNPTDIANGAPFIDSFPYVW